jgi:cytosine/adenosine deaminase-related metal-dependent hydrolase
VAFKLRRCVIFRLDSPVEKTLLIRNAMVLVTMDESRREIADGAVFVRGNRIEQVGPSDQLPQQADEIIDARSLV